jgi:AraC-like DNA-binding protein
MEFPESDPSAVSAYEKLVAPMFDFKVPDSARDLPFSAATEVYCLPDVTVSKVTSTATRLTRTVRTIAGSATDEVLVLCYTAGHYTFRIGDSEHRVEPGEVAFFDLSQEMVIEAPSVENVSLVISRRRLETMIPMLDTAHGFVVPQGALARVLVGTVQQVLAAGASTRPTEAGPIADALILLVGACLELASQPKTTSGVATGAVSLAMLKGAIEQRLTDPDFGPQTLLDEFRITRSSLYRAFEPLGGVGAYISERRLRHAFRRMTDTSQTELRLSQLAFDLGFAHASAFTRSFKARFGLTPKEIRTLAVRPGGEEVPFVLSPAVFPYIRPLDRQ